MQLQTFQVIIFFLQTFRPFIVKVKPANAQTESDIHVRPGGALLRLI